MTIKDERGGRLVAPEGWEGLPWGMGRVKSDKTPHSPVALSPKKRK